MITNLKSSVPYTYNSVYVYDTTQSMRKRNGKYKMVNNTRQQLGYGRFAPFKITVTCKFGCKFMLDENDDADRSKRRVISVIQSKIFETIYDTNITLSGGFL